MAAVAREVGVDAPVNMSQMTVSQMSIQNTTPKPAQQALGTRRSLARPVSNGCILFVVFAQGGGQASARYAKPSGVPSWRSFCSSIAIHGEPSQPSPEEMQALQAAWYTWMQKFSSAIVGGDGLKPSGRLVKAGIVTDGPYVEAKEVIASFSMIQADNLDAAVAIARECPGD